jgi:SAM-dependent methyltransferase
MDLGESAEGGLQVPQIYKLIASGADPAAISVQMMRDQHAPRNPGERLFLGFDELRSRKKEGTNTLRALAQGEDVVALAARAFLKNPDMSMQKAEQLLGIERWGTVVANNKPDGFAESVYKHARRRGFTDLETAEQFSYTTLLEGKFLKRHHLNNDLEQGINIGGDTFGSVEPEYLELLGPREILRLRGLKDGNMLLLGSMGKYSAGEFANYNRKINPHLKTHVLEIDPQSVERIRADTQAAPREVRLGDATKLDYPDASMQHVYTNMLFSHLRPGPEPHVNYIRDITQIMKGALRVLMPGGSLVLVEGAFGDHRKKPKREHIKADIKRLAIMTGFRVVAESGDVRTFTFAAEVGTSSIDENGFPHYEDRLIVKNRNNALGIRFIKPED